MVVAESIVQYPKLHSHPQESIKVSVIEISSQQKQTTLLWLTGTVKFDNA